MLDMYSAVGTKPVPKTRNSAISKPLLVRDCKRMKRTNCGGMLRSTSASWLAAFNRNERHSGPPAPWVSSLPSLKNSS